MLGVPRKTSLSSYGRKAYAEVHNTSPRGWNCAMQSSKAWVSTFNTAFESPIPNSKFSIEQWNANIRCIILNLARKPPWNSNIRNMTTSIWVKDCDTFPSTQVKLEAYDIILTTIHCEDILKFLVSIIINTHSHIFLYPFGTALDIKAGDCKGRGITGIKR